VREAVCRKGPGSTSRMERGKNREREGQEQVNGGILWLLEVTSAVVVATSPMVDRPRLSVWDS